jgi:LysM repeat protein
MLRFAARLAAPLALAAVVLGVYLIVHSTLPRHHAATTQSQTTLQTHTPTRHHKRLPKYYVVKSGDTLSLIAQKTHVPLSRLLKLNPSVSSPPYSLQTGQRLRLR